MMTEDIRTQILATYPKKAQMLLGPSLLEGELAPYIPAARKLWAPRIMLHYEELADFAVKHKISWNSAFRCFCIVA